jgi:uncharacterized protein YoxC
VPQQDLVNRLVNRVNDFNKRIRDLEEKVRNITARVNTLDDSLLDKTNDLQEDIQDLEEEISDVRDRIANMEVDIKELNREKKKYVTQQEIDEIENYIDLMNPIQSSFATKKEVKEIVQSQESLSTEEVKKMIENEMKSGTTPPNNKKESQNVLEEGER